MNGRPAWKHPIGFARDTWKAFSNAQPYRYSAALSYYTLLSMAPLLLVLTGLGGLLLGEASFRHELLSQVDALVGRDGAQLLQQVMEHAKRPGRGIVSMAVGVALILFGATTVFAELQSALNALWGVEAAPRSAVSGFVRARLESFAMVLGTGFLLVVSLVLTSAMAAVQSGLGSDGIVLAIADTLTSLAFLTIVFALLFKYVPDVDIAWRDTWFGAVLTAVLFTIGKIGIGFYLGQASVGSAYGAAGSAVVMMVWVYYAALIFFLGAVATRVLARWRGSPLRPSAHARSVEPDPVDAALNTPESA